MGSESGLVVLKCSVLLSTAHKRANSSTGDVGMYLKASMRTWSGGDCEAVFLKGSWIHVLMTYGA